MFRRITKRFLILVNIVVAILFLIGSYAGTIENESLWFTGFFTLIAPYLLIILAGFILLWLFTRPGWMVVGLLTIALAWKPIGHMVALRFAPNFTIKKHPKYLRVMTWNIEHLRIHFYKDKPELKAQMLDLVNRYDPDVACFQEFVGGDAITAINYTDDIMRTLKMKGYHYSYNRKLDFDKDHHFGIITFSKYPIVNKHTISYAPNDYNSIYQYIDLVKETDTFRVFNVHLQSLRFSSQNMDYITAPNTDKALSQGRNVVSKMKNGFVKRIRQSRRIKDEVLKSPYPAIVCGDFNDVPLSHAYSIIGKDMKNAFAEAGTGMGRTFKTIAPTLRIDNIFTDKRFQVQQTTRVLKDLSDHYPVVTDLYYSHVD